MRADAEALGRYVLQPAEGALPLTPEAVYGRSAPLCVEIGFGGGEALAWQATARPHRDHLGIELPADCLVRAAATLHKAGVSNARLVRGDARFLLDLLLAPGSVERVLMQFPMPWPKQRHAKHRVTSPAFADALARVLAPGARFELVTDQGWYAEEAEAVFRAHAAFDALEAAQNPPRAFRTRYERRWLADGRTIHRLRVVRAATPAPDAVLTSIAMENLRLDALPDAAAVLALQDSRYQDGELQAEVKRIWRAEGGWLLQVASADAGFAQLFHLTIRQRTDGSSLLQVGRCPRPYWTPAVRHALRAVGERLGAVLPA